MAFAADFGVDAVRLAKPGEAPAPDDPGIHVGNGELGGHATNRQRSDVGGPVSRSILRFTDHGNGNGEWERCYEFEEALSNALYPTRGIAYTAASND